MSLRLFCALPLLFPAALFASPSQEAIQWLNRMSTAAHALNYEGTLIYQHAGILQTMQVFHRSDGVEERERWVALDGATSEVLRKEGKVICVHPDRTSTAIDDAGSMARPFDTPDRLDRLDKSYRLEAGGEERIAGALTRKIELAPRDRYRFGQTLWLDVQSGLLRKAELRDERGAIVEQWVFTRLEVYDAPLPPERVAAPSNGHGAAPSTSAIASTPSERTWRVASLPAGFREEMRQSRTPPGGTAPQEHLLFTDGVASVSVFIEPESERSGEAARTARKGALNAYTRYVENYKVTVLGDVPVATVRLIGDSVKAHRSTHP